MRISLLEKREPFGELLCRTLVAFLDKRGMTGHSALWHRKPPILHGRGTRSGIQRWLCNPYLNAIFLADTDRKNLEPLVRELSGSPTAWRRPLQRLFAAVASSRLTARLLARSYLDVVPGIPGSQDWVLVGGNHKLRILDRPAGRSWVIVKHGRPVSQLASEIQARKLASAHGVLIPEVLETGADGSYLAERYVCGTPLNRLPDASARRRGVTEVGEALTGFSNTTRTATSLAAYLDTLPLPDTELVANLRSRLEPGTALLLSRAHGDFQDANILSAGDRTWLIDWEYAGIRQHGYDALVYALRTRFPRGLSDRFRTFVGSDPDDLLRLWNNPLWGSAIGRRISVDLLALEELALGAIESSLGDAGKRDPKRELLELELHDWLRR